MKRGAGRIERSDGMGLDWIGFRMNGRILMGLGWVD